MSDNPIKLWPGPTVDGRPTFFVLGHDFYQFKGWERRSSDRSPWTPWAEQSFGGAHAPTWYQARPIADPPEPANYLQKTGSGSGTTYVVLWSEMKNRADLDSWERSTLRLSGVRTWTDLNPKLLHDDYPIRVRRKR